MNVVSRRCECGRARPSFGPPGEASRWCARCPSKPGRALHGSHQARRPPSAPPLPRQARGPTPASGGGAASLVGRQVTRLFHDPAAPPSAPPRPYIGEVMAVRTGVPRHGTVWRVVYEDEDEEELSWGELEGALQGPVYVKEEDGPLEVKRVKREA